MSKCGSCEHFNLWYDLKDHVSERGTYGECMFPHRMNLDDISEIEKLEKAGKLKRKKVSIYYSCLSYMPEHCYSDW